VTVEGDDYTKSGSTITMTPIIPIVGDKLYWMYVE
jgi:hypothetical protein